MMYGNDAFDHGKPQYGDDGKVCVYPAKRIGHKKSEAGTRIFGYQKIVGRTMRSLAHIQSRHY